MTGLQLTKVHEYRKVDGDETVRLIRTNPLIRVRVGESPPIFVQGGRAYAEGGDEYPLEELPSWFWVEAQKASSAVAQETGLVKLLNDYNLKNKPKTLRQKVAERRRLRNGNSQRSG